MTKVGSFSLAALPFSNLVGGVGGWGGGGAGGGDFGRGTNVLGGSGGRGFGGCFGVEIFNLN